jgi:GT2 family glycosyltransferase
VVIPSYNGRALLERCLASVNRHRPPEIEVIVADDGSTDGSVEWLASRHPDVRVVALERNGGFCAAANAGLAAARAPIIQLLNNDTEVSEGWIEAGLAPFSDRTVGSVAPLVLVRSNPERVDSAGDQYALVGWPTKRGHGQAAILWESRPTEEVFGASGSSAFYRAESLRKVGGFDPDFGSYYEDIDLAFRLRWGGYRCMFAPDCRILHDVSASYEHGKPELQRRMSRNAEIVFWSNLPPRLLLTAALPHLAFLGIQAVWRLVRGRLRPFASGKLDAARAWSRLNARRRIRRDLAKAAVSPPRFPLRWGILSDVGNHLNRPRETSSRPIDRRDLS